ncbi:MAG: rhodanese-like domain-containing protein [Saprospiraceae bacterium]|jgi:rhodanese-related sulfurtransferase|nr:rhodanese-like domain-containing protein [Saprospiraceae bacterium]
MEISVQGLKAKMDNKEDFVLIDVREKYEYEEFNIGGKLIPLGEIMGALEDLEEFKGKEIIIHCRSGKRSAMAQQLMLQAGFSDVKNLAGGVLAWQDM